MYRENTAENGTEGKIVQRRVTSEVVCGHGAG